MRLLLMLLSIFIFESAFGQSTHSRIKFVEYLNNQHYYQESLHENQRITRKHLLPQQLDSLNYFAGWASYNLKLLDDGVVYFKQVSASSPLYSKSWLFGAYSQLHLNQYKQAEVTLRSFEPIAPRDYQFQQFLMSGRYLLMREFEEFETAMNDVSDTYFGFNQERQNLMSLHDELINHRSKSPALAGLFSALVPGSGKIYAGKTGQGITTFLITTGLGLVTWENYTKRGATSFETILFGSAFAAFYGGNIYGSMFTAKTSNDEFTLLQNQKILFNIHIPLRNIYN